MSFMEANRRTEEKEFLDDSFVVPVYYEDTDFSGYVFHPNYLKYFDRAREEIIGTPLLKELFEAGLHFVVKSASQEFLRPVQHGDTLRIKTRVRFSHSPLVFFRHEALVMAESGECKTTAVVADIELVSINRKGQPVRLPRVLHDLFSRKYFQDH